MRAADVMRRSLKWSFALAIVVGLVGATVGVVAAGFPGAAGAFWGAGMAVVFLGITTVSIRIAAHFPPTVFFAIVMGSWMAKMLVFLVLILLLGKSDGINGTVLFVCLVVVMVGTLAIDVIALTRSRLPYVDEPSDATAHNRDETEEDGVNP